MIRAVSEKGKLRAEGRKIEAIERKMQLKMLISK